MSNNAKRITFTTIVIATVFIAMYGLLLWSMSVGHKNECKGWHSDIENGERVHLTAWMKEQCAFYHLPL
jgi:Ca2+/H+ antiporter